VEVSSHALSLGRVGGVSFDVAIFTNLTRDHFDFHPDFAAYFAAKRSLFDQLKRNGRSVVYIGGEWGRRLAVELERPVTCGPGGMVRAEDVRLDAAGIGARVETPVGSLDLHSPLIGAFNLANLLAAVGGAIALDLPLEAIAHGVASCPRLPGRLEPVEAGQPFPVFIDFAHTDAALQAVIRSIRELHPGRLIVVFGCGGDRDPGKRVLMGRIAGEMSDLPIVTTDNPRSEDPLAIIATVEEGLKQSGNTDYRVVPDRREAIRRAISIADGSSAVLIAGKGSEQAQIVNGERLPFSDREEARQALEALYG
jgi:UDP-N-acetylmuramoyl-L-alanyl-D-glutamate--2,6-diaminopimelate ligase